MVKTSFATTVMELYNYFRYSKLPSTQQIDLWHDDVKFIPDVALGWIFDKLKREDSIPRNLPKAFISQWYSYRKANPDKTITDYEYCEDCFGNGIHMFKVVPKFKGDFPYTYVARCAQCDNWKKKLGSLAETGGVGPTDRGVGAYVYPVPRVTKQQLIDAGFEYIGLTDPKEKIIKLEVPKVELKEIPKTPKVYSGPRQSTFD